MFASHAKSRLIATPDMWFLFLTVINIHHELHETNSTFIQVTKISNFLIMDTHYITILRCVAMAVFPAAAWNSRVCDADEGGCSPTRVGTGFTVLINVAVPIELFLCCYITCKYVVLLEMQLWIYIACYLEYWWFVTYFKCVSGQYKVRVL